MGIPGEFEKPKFLDALGKVIAVAQEHGLAAAIQPRSVEQAEDWLGLGFNVISFSSDRSLYLAALTMGITTVRALSAK